MFLFHPRIQISRRHLYMLYSAVKLWFVLGDVQELSQWK